MVALSAPFGLLYVPAKLVEPGNATATAAVASIFWGLWLFPFGLLVIRCGFIPPALAHTG